MSILTEEEFLVDVLGILTLPSSRIDVAILGAEGAYSSGEFFGRFLAKFLSEFEPVLQTSKEPERYEIGRHVYLRLARFGEGVIKNTKWNYCIVLDRHSPRIYTKNVVGVGTRDEYKLTKGLTELL